MRGWQVHAIRVTKDFEMMFPALGPFPLDLPAGIGNCAFKPISEVPIDPDL
jgi:hypothetical protein